MGSSVVSGGLFVYPPDVKLKNDKAVLVYPAPCSTSSFQPRRKPEPNLPAHATASAATHDDVDEDIVGVDLAAIRGILTGQRDIG